MVRKYHAANRERLNERKRYAANPEKHRESVRKWDAANREKIKERRAERHAERYEHDPQYRLALQLRSCLSGALKGNFKTGSAVRNLGCSIEELRAYLEAQFQSGMSWKNHGKRGWHIDHIKSLAAFDLTDHAQLLKACHYTNLQPLWAAENLSKGAR